MMFNPAGGSMDHHQSGMLAWLDWMLCDQVVWKVEIKLGCEHPYISAMSCGHSCFS